MALVAASGVDEINIGASASGSALQQMLTAPDIEPGDSPSYELCKQIYLYHPLGAKLTSGPIRKAMSQPRTIAVPDSPEEMVAKRFTEQWRDDKCDDVILSLHTQARVYGVSTVGLLIAGIATTEPADYMKLWQQKIAYNVWDPLNTSGSIIGNQDPNAFDFQKHGDIAIQGTAYHRGRTWTVMHEGPIYIAWTTSAYGYVGRSVYQRILFPLRTFVQTMFTDDFASIKAGLLVAQLKPVGSIADRIQKFMFGIKRALIKIARLGGVLTISEGEEVQSLDLQNLAEPAKMARENALKNCAMGADMPAIMIEEETLTEGFGEGTEDAKVIAQYTNGIRRDMERTYAWVTQIVQHRAWNPEFYETVQAAFPEEYAGVDYTTAFYRWKNSFTAEWPNLLTEPESEKSKQDKVRQETIIATFEALEPVVDPVNLGTLITWVCDNLNSQKTLFSNPLNLDPELIIEHKEDQQEQALEMQQAGMAGDDDGDGEGKEPKPPNPLGGRADARRRSRRDEGVDVPAFLRRSSATVDAVVRAVDGMNGHGRPKA